MALLGVFPLTHNSFCSTLGLLRKLDNAVFDIPLNSNMTLPESAKIRVVCPLGRPRSDYKSAHLLVSNQIYWKEANGNEVKEPLSFSDILDADSLELIRLDDGAWSDVNEVVKENKDDGCRRITVYGRLHARPQRDIPILPRKVQI